MIWCFIGLDGLSWAGSNPPGFFIESNLLRMSWLRPKPDHCHPYFHLGFTARGSSFSQFRKGSHRAISNLRKKNMDQSDRKYLEDEDTPIMKTIKGATMGLAAGSIWGTIVASWYDVPRVERSVALPGLIRTLKMCGNYGITFAAVGGLYIGVEQLVQKQRMKKDFINGAVGAFVAGASVYGFKGKSIQTAISAGSLLAFTSSVLDIGGRTTRIDNGKEYYPYTTEKRPSVNS